MQRALWSTQLGRLIDWFIPDSEIDKELIEEKKAGTPDTILFG
jgi:hypothetical protein